jgi:4-hydroxythreonine-4-phosphate dehydrogenase
MRETRGRVAKPTIGITMGDPAGVGPEIIVKALGSRRVRACCRAVVIGRPEVLDTISRPLDSPRRFATVSDPSRRTAAGSSPLIEAGAFLADLRLGRPRAAGGRAAVAAIEKAAELALAGDINGIVTAPISKEAIRRGGSPFPGHTEMLASLTGTRNYAMMLVGGGLRVSLATIHIPLREVPRSLTTGGIRRVIDLTWQALGDFGAADAKIAVCGLNPHAGEAGIMGEEDRRLIAPAVRAAARKGIPVSGPWPADTIFYRAARGEFGAVVAMYHDQGLIPLKTLAFDSGVNLTLGLPIIRTSVDHGTAYDIAGKGVASPSSLMAAIEIAAGMARQRAARA